MTLVPAGKDKQIRQIATHSLNFASKGSLSAMAASLGRAAFRVLSYGIVAVNLLTFGTFLYVIAPYTSYFFFNDWRFWNYLKYYHRYFLYSASYILAILTTHRELARDVLPLTAPAMLGPSPDQFRIAKDWTLPADSCGECNRCCTFVVTCCFLDKATNRCPCYGSLFWRYFNCGRFPSTRELIDNCGCSKFEVID